MGTFPYLSAVLSCCLVAFFACFAPSTMAVGRRRLGSPQLYELDDRYRTLVHELLYNYTKEIIPDRPLVVKMDVLLFKVKSAIEKEGIFESVIGLVIEWRDKRMQWDPEKHDNLKLLAFDSDKVWLPDVAMTNAAEHLYSISRDTNFIVRVNSDGLMRFVPTGTARTWCRLKLTRFPFDSQTCSLEFESWSLDSSTMTFDGNSSVILDSSFDSTLFHLCHTKAVTYQYTYGFSGETFTRIRIDLTVQRKSTFYVMNLIFPCATLSFIQLLAFFLSPVETTVDRIGFGTTNLLTLVVFQTIVTEEMPKTSDAVTALSKYIIALIVVSAFAILESVFVERMQSMEEKKPPMALVRLMSHIPVIFREKSILKVYMSLNGEESETELQMRKASGVAAHGLPPSPEIGDQFYLYRHSSSKPLSFMHHRNVQPYEPNYSNRYSEIGLNGWSSQFPQMSQTRNLPYCYAARQSLGVDENKKPPRRRKIRRSFLGSSSLSSRTTDYTKFQHPEENAAFDTGIGVDYNQLRKSQPSIYTTTATTTPNNKPIWRELAHRIDFVCFFLCAVFLTLVPAVLFIPNMMSYQECKSFLFTTNA